VLGDTEKEKEFWYDFDNVYNFQVDPTTDGLVGIVFNYSRQKSFGTLSADVLKADMQSEASLNVKSAVEKLIPGYLKLFHKYFGDDFDQKTIISSPVWEAFRDFGLGVLYDPRPPRTRRRLMHVMDGGKQLYCDWHRFNWIASIANPENQFSHSAGTWLYIDRLVGLSFEIFSISKPCQTKSDGKPRPNGGNITENNIADLTGIWSNLGFDQIETRMSQLSDHDPDGLDPVLGLACR
jgi:hypothetical protein